MLLPPAKITSVFPLDGRVKIREIGLKTGNKHLDYLIFLGILPFFLGRRVAIANLFVTFFPVFVASILFRVRYFYLVQDIENRYVGRVGWLLNGMCMLSYASRRLVAANPYLAERLVALGREPLLVTNIGLQGAFFATTPPSRNCPFDVIYFPRKETWKRLDRFDRIVAALREREAQEMRFLCVSQDESMLARYRSSPGITCTRPAGDRELIACYDSAKVLLMTSESEGFGLPPLEALARGRPAVAFPAGGPSLFLEDGVNSFIVEDEEAACRRLLQLVHDGELYGRMSQAAIETSSRFRLDSGLDHLISGIELDGASGANPLV